MAREVKFFKRKSQKYASASVKKNKAFHNFYTVVLSLSIVSFAPENVDFLRNKK